MRDGTEKAKPKRVIVKNILYELGKTSETIDCVKCGEDLWGDSVIMWFMRGGWRMAVPASPTPAVAGTRQHDEKQEKKNTSKKLGFFLCFGGNSIGYPLDQHLAHTLCLDFCMASECGRLFLIGCRLDLQEMDQCDAMVTCT